MDSNDISSNYDAIRAAEGRSEKLAWDMFGGQGWTEYYQRENTDWGGILADKKNGRNKVEITWK